MKVRHLYHEIKPGGGPGGYLHNLLEAQRLHGPDDDYELEVSDGAKLRSDARSNLLRLVRRFRTDLLSQTPRFGARAEHRKNTRVLIDYLDTTYAGITRSDATRFFETDVLIVHSTLLASRLQRLCPEIAARKLVLMTHSPTFLAYELAVAMNPGVPEAELVQEPYVRSLVARELRIMQAARAVLWPCEESQIGYPDWWQLFRDGKTSNVYAETGTQRPSAKASREEMRSAWGVPNDRRVALFIGRAHPHKGFDRFVDWADWNRSRSNREWEFVHCGGASQVARDLSAISEAGYVSDNGAAYLAADLVLIPNTYSYFDLGLLEAISLGTRVAIAPTGGHGYLARRYSVPTIPDGPAEEVWPTLEVLADEYAKDDSRSLALTNQWQEHFSLDPFYANLKSVPAQLAVL